MVMIRPPTLVLAEASTLVQPVQVTLALLVRVPLAPGMTTNWTDPLTPGSRSPRFQVTVPPLFVPPLEADTKVTPPGKVSVSTTLLAIPVPVLA